MSMQLPSECVSRALNRGTGSIRHDYWGVVQRILNRGDQISAKEFRASFPIGVEALARKDGLKQLTIHAGKKSSGDPLVTLVAAMPEDQQQPPENGNGRSFCLEDLKQGVEAIAGALRSGVDRIPIRNSRYGDRGIIVAFAMKPESGIA